MSWPRLLTTRIVKEMLVLPSGTWRMKVFMTEWSRWFCRMTTREIRTGFLDALKTSGSRENSLNKKGLPLAIPILSNG